MIAYLTGQVKNKGLGFIILEVNQIGYKVFINPAMYADIDINQKLELYTYQNVREDALELYGFSALSHLEMFELLLTISGVGPKSALGVMAVASIEDIKESIARGDSSLLTKVSGIGKKTAERVVLELREKVGALTGSATAAERTSIVASSEEIDALIALGYSLMQAREALKRVDPKVKDSGERIKAALKSLGS